MKKKLVIFLLIVMTCVFGASKIEARECKYDYKGNEITLNFTKKEDSDEFSVNYSMENSNKYDGVYNFVDGKLIDSDDQCYGSLNVCKLDVRNVPNGYFIGGVIGIIVNESTKQEYIGIFGSSLDSLTIDDAYANEFDEDNYSIWSNLFWTGRGVTCETVEYSGEKLDKSKKVYFCDKVVQLYSNIANAYKSYEECGDIVGDNPQKASIARCKSRAITEVNKHTDTLKSTCDSILQNQSLSVEDGCISSCLQANKSIQILKEDYIGLENFDNDCSFSDRLVIWIANIVKWIKYIIPVAVMVLGILDFIKAIAAGKDDEMKKAQGNFIKRLIAAALIFIIPLIIEFVLDKMGFTSNGCGIIDL